MSMYTTSVIVVSSSCLRVQQVLTGRPYDLAMGVNIWGNSRRAGLHRTLVHSYRQHERQVPTLRGLLQPQLTCHEQEKAVPGMLLLEGCRGGM